MTLRHRALWARLIGDRLWVLLYAYDHRQRSESPATVSVAVGDSAPGQTIDVLAASRQPKSPLALLRCIHLLRLPLPDGNDGEANHRVRFTVQTGEGRKRRGVRYPRRDSERQPRLNYAPVSPRFRGGSAEHLRRTAKDLLVFVRRPMVPIERTVRFRLRESWLVSAVLSLATGAARRAGRRSVTVFYEKFAAHADEGAFELFTEFQQRAPHSFFVIDASSPDAARVLRHPHAIRKFSWRYYWAIYRADTYVGTEIPTHLNLLRSNNGWLRRRVYTTPYVFLQHGIIYLKNLSHSPFGHGREGESAFIVASSAKEKDVIVRDLGLAPDQVLVTGLGQFGLLQPGTIGPATANVITVMPTWRAEDETVNDFSGTTYVLVMRETVDAIRTVAPSAQIRLVPHPKVAEQLATTELAPDLWAGSVADALTDTKLLITDYSSVAYNAFYRGSAVLFYQPDLAAYEQRTGPLIPSPDEYVGFRSFDSVGLRDRLSTGLSADGDIDLAVFRTAEHERQYALINEFDDGRNLERIQTELRRVLLGE
ncbi:hypothetical protein GCM10009847_01920 [Leucobacter tardus]|uniref:CDP-glycerol glycerophosphotransferase family protein n=1 Tax=Leucobacter tardus TaxID=501483 RepID=A0A939QDX2_9MICO|nr:CDP-glycerol glycerophosphotransferase family protein [Leucobacter tardus]MBO2988403.1 CDP-glycerol glycerophosphotransferase family protein [Leucobacter tardus]